MDSGYHRGLHRTYTLEQFAPVELRVVEKCVRVAVSGNELRPLPHPLSDFRPTDTLPVQQPRATGSTGFEGAGLDGVITKRDDTAYQHDTRVMMKIKHVRTVDFVVAGTACKGLPPARLDRLRSGGRMVRAPAVPARR